MDMDLKHLFLLRWKEYFDQADLPVTFQYTDNGIQAEPALSTSRERCVIHMLQHVREGRSLRFFARSFGCSGGKYHTGYTSHLREDYTEYLSCGQDGVLKGERFKQTPELARQSVEQTPWYEAPGAHLVFKRWDKLDEHDDPEIAIFFATPDVLSGLYMLAGFDEPSITDTVIAPFGSGCASIIDFPYAEKLSGRSRPVIGMFDITARPWVGGDRLTFAVGMEKLTRMIGNMNQSFLTTSAWEQIRKRMRRERIQEGRRLAAD
jgi:uncharacterized protein (DUF169 family)